MEIRKTFLYQDYFTISAIQCPALTAPAFGLLSPIGVTAYLTVVNVICNTGYVLNGTDDTTCEADGTWSNPVPTCTRKY